MEKGNCFPSYSVSENPFHLQSEQRENYLILYTNKIYISFDKLLPSQKWIKEPFEL